MSRVLISILSDYLQPNFLLIKEMAGRYDRLVFITTADMESEKKQKSHWLEKALKLPEKSVSCIEVIEDDFDEIRRRLDEEKFSKMDSFLLNITGGTKVIPLAVYEYFTAQKYKAEFFYVPNNKNVVKNLSSHKETELHYRLNLEEYFTLNGLRYEATPGIYPKSAALNLFNEFRKVNFNRLKHKKIAEAQTLASPEDRVYYGGEWFEEYCYHRLKDENGLDNTSIAHGNRIFRGENIQNDNEIDVMFIKDNQLYIFECKYSLGGGFVNHDLSKDGMKDNLENFMYKLAAVAKDYGFRPRSYILTLHDIKKKYGEAAMANLEKRQHILGINGVLDCRDFSQSKPLLRHEEEAAGDSHHVRMIESIKTELPKVELKVIGKIDLTNIPRR